jgi:hypothetical protein
VRTCGGGTFLKFFDRHELIFISLCPRGDVGHVNVFIKIGQALWVGCLPDLLPVPGRPSLEHRTHLSRSKFISGTRMSPSILIPSMRLVAGHLTFASTAVKLAEESRTISLHCSGLSKMTFGDLTCCWMQDVTVSCCTERLVTSIFQLNKPWARAGLYFMRLIGAPGGRERVILHARGEGGRRGG